jgi:hypothetical protein
MLVRGDDYYMAVCNKSGTIAIYNESYNLFLSPFADGPIKFNGTLNDRLNIENISKFGRSFSIVRVPYAFKLLIQELQAMNIQLRIITEANVNQLTSMSFSDNIEKLLGRSVTIKELNTINYNNVVSSAGIGSNSAEVQTTKVENKLEKGFTKLVQPFFLKWLYGEPHSDFFGSFLLMSNARAGSSYLQSSLSALGAIGDFEFALRPYNPPMPHQRFMSLGVDDVASEIHTLASAEHSVYGSKLTLPIYDYLSEKEINQLYHSCKNIHRPIHLVRHYWDLLKSNLSRGVAHDFANAGKGWTNTNEMHKAYSKLPGTDLGPDKPSVFVSLPEESLKGYLLNLVRNDFAFALIRENHSGMTVSYESLVEVGTFKRLLEFLRVEYSDVTLQNVLENPALRKLPTIPDSNIPYGELLRDATECCYRFYQNCDSEKRSAKQIFEAQLREISRVFGH